MAMVPVSERLRYIMELRGVNQTDILRMAAPICERRGLKLYKSKLSQYISGEFKPKDEMCELLAEVLDVSPARLAGYNAPMDRETPISDKSADSCSDREESIRAMISSLSSSFSIENSDRT